MAPRLPTFEASAIADHAMDSPGLRHASAERGAWLSLVAFVRHRMTDYDVLLADGYDQDSARHFVRDAINQVLQDWGVRRRIADDHDPTDAF